MAYGALIADTADGDTQFLVKGSMPNACFAQRFGDGQRKESFFDPTGYGEVKLKVTNGDVTGDGSIVIQQLRR